MRNNRIFLATMAVAMLFVASCQKESSVFQEFSACMEEGASDAKTTLNEINNQLQWQHGTDQVSITGIATTTNTTDNTTSIQTTTSTFTAVVHSSYPNNLSYANLELNSDQTALTEPSTNTTVSYRAIYPATIARNNNTQVNLPQYQASTSGELTGYPMYAESDNKSLQFKNLCSVLKLSLTGTETINKIEVVTDKYVSGTFNIDPSDPSNPTLEADNTTTDNIRMTTLTMSTAVELDENTPSYFYIYLPVQQYNYIKINVYNEDNLVYSKAARITNGITLERSKYHLLELSTPAFEPSVLCGEFSVSSNQKVSFSKGNLLLVSHTYTEETGTVTYWLLGNRTDTYVSATNTVDVYKFADNQYDRNEGTNPSYDTWLFEWGSSYESNTMFKRWHGPYSRTYNVYPHAQTKSRTDSYSGSLQNGGNIDWKCLSQTQWDYLLRAYTRITYYNNNLQAAPSGENRCFTLGTVCGVHGMIIFPDVFYWPLDNKEPGQFGPGSYTNWGGNNHSFDSEEWRILEGAGCVFLPATGFRNDQNGHTSTTINGQNDDGTYWSTQINTYNSPYYLQFNTSRTTAFSDNHVGDQSGHYYAIRLVKFRSNN